MKNRLAPVVLLSAVLLVSACGGSGELVPVGEAEEKELKAELDDRSFRQFEPSVDASPRKGVVLSFFDGVSLWAQYAEGDRAVDEWEVSADDYRVKRAGDSS